MAYDEYGREDGKNLASSSPYRISTNIKYDCSRLRGATVFKKDGTAEFRLGVLTFCGKVGNEVETYPCVSFVYCYFLRRV